MPNFSQIGEVRWPRVFEKKGSKVTDYRSLMTGLLCLQVFSEIRKLLFAIRPLHYVTLLAKAKLAVNEITEP